MIFTSILILIVAKAIPSINRNLPSIYFTRISSIIFIYAGVLSLNTLYIQSIGSGIGIYSGLFQVTQASVLIESFLLIIGSLILISWPSINQYVKFSSLANGQKIFKNNINLANNTITQNYSLGSVGSSPHQQTDYSLIVLFISLVSFLLISIYFLLFLYIII